MIEISIDKIEFDLNGLKKKNEEYIDTLKRLGLPYDCFTLEVDFDDEVDEDNVDELDEIVEDEVYDYIRENYGETYADRIISVGWGVC